MSYKPLYPRFSPRLFSVLQPWRWRTPALLVLSLLLLLLPIAPLAGQSTLPLAPTPRVAIGDWPLAFTPNRGQSAPPARFLTRSLVGDLFFSAQEIVMSLPPTPQQRMATTRLAFIDSNPQVVITPAQRLPGVINHFYGRDPAQWQRNLPTYGSLIYRQLYTGIDLHYTGKQGALKGTYYVAAGADPSQIRWHYPNARSLTVDDATGELRIDLAPARRGEAGRRLQELAPVAWQQVGGLRVPVNVAYQIAADQSVSFRVGAYDASQLLIIDPFLLYGALLGGSKQDEGRAIAVDQAGNVYLTGTTLSPDFAAAAAPQPAYAGPPTANFGDAFIAKLDPTGKTLLYMTYLGGSGQDIGAAITVDSGGNAYITGMTESDNFPTQNAYQASPPTPTCANKPCADAFVSKLNPAGNALLFSTYLGGGGEENLGLLDTGTLATALGLAVDGNQQIYVAGVTDSANFPTQNAAFATRSGLDDIFLSKFAADGKTLLYSTYLGGSGAESSGGVAVDANGNAYLAGSTLASNFPLRNPIQDQNKGIPDLVIAQFDTTKSGDASWIFSSYFGGSGGDFGMAIAVDANSLYLAGHTHSLDFPTQNGYQPTNASAGDPIPRDAFVTRLALTNHAVQYSTYLGGDDYDVAYGMALSPQGRVYLTGRTNSTNFPLREAWQGGRRQSIDLFVAQLDPTKSGAASLVYSSYLGTNGEDYSYGIAVDSAQNAYVIGLIDGIDSRSLPVYTTLGPADVNKGVVVAKLSPLSTQRLYLPLVRR